MDPGVFSRQLLMTVEWFKQNYSSWWLKEHPRLWGIYGGNIPLFRFRENFCGSKDTRTLLPCRSAEVTLLLLFFFLFIELIFYSFHICTYGICACTWAHMCVGIHVHGLIHTCGHLRLVFSIPRHLEAENLDLIALTSPYLSLPGDFSVSALSAVIINRELMCQEKENITDIQ